MVDALSEEVLAKEYLAFARKQVIWTGKGFGEWLYQRHYRGWRWPELRAASDTSVFLWQIRLREADYAGQKKELPRMLRPERYH